ncbi:MULTISPECIES: DUF1146 family protein [Lactiplantibacillus]|jgi:uncharacterized integral membrane protein (TIGR02327 family)|uniref:DUF1146 family protein n=2 Tax=Lactiplantibacillus TaxID=2767842 RepID=A0ABW1R3A1_9LACO|nr:MULTISPECIES: DUF1146 family protein [Lactiplantibacillus]
MRGLGVQALLNLVSQFLFIWIAFWALQPLRLDRKMDARAPQQARALIVLLAVVIGYTASQFFWSFFDAVRNLTYLVR